MSAARVWVLSADKPGDDAQATLLADAVGWPYAVKRAGDALAPPWPELVIASGRLTEAAARGIAARSAGAVRLVQIGRPHGPLARLDLVVAPPQYDLPDHPRVVQLALPLQRVSRAAVARAAATWTPPVGQPLPRPWLAVLVGGTARPYVLDAGAARDLGVRVSAAARATSGSLLVTTSRRTAAAAADALVASLSAPAMVHRWSPGAPANPYLVFLGVADRIVVTADSASMLADAVSTGKPVEIFPLPSRRGRLRDIARRLAWSGALPDPLVTRLGIRPPRDLARLHQALYTRGLAAPFGSPTAPRPCAEGDDELTAVAARIRALVG